MKRFWKILLSMTLVFMLVPAVAFAEDGDYGKPVSISFNAAVTPQYYEGQTDDYIDIGFPGNSVTVKYEKASLVYKYVRYEESEDSYYDGWYLNGDVSSEDEIYPDATLQNGNAVIECELYDDVSENYVYLSCVAEAKPYPYPVSLKYEGADLIYTEGDTELEGFYTEGNKVTVTYSDESSVVYKCIKFTDEYGDEDNRYFANGKPEKDEYGYYSNQGEFYTDVPESGIKSGTTSVKFTYTESYYSDDKVASGNFPVKEAAKPKTAKLVGTLGSAYVGQKELYLDEVAKKGTKLVVTFTDGSKVTYKYISYKEGKDTYWGFFPDGDKTKGSLWGYAHIKKGLEKGKNKVKFELHFDEYGNGSVKATVKASKLFAYSEHETYTYTGKKITPKIVVKDGKGKTVPAKAYTVKFYNSKGKLVKKPVGKKWGTYDYKITFKKAYRSKYLNPIWSSYSIGPKGTSIKSLTAGKKKFTIKWKKRSSGISGYSVQYSRYKDFRDYYEDDFSKDKTSGVITELTSKKTYYVRILTYKNYKERSVHSKPSKVMKVKIK